MLLHFRSISSIVFSRSSFSPKTKSGFSFLILWISLWAFSACLSVLLSVSTSSQLRSIRFNHSRASLRIFLFFQLLFFQLLVLLVLQLLFLPFLLQLLFLLFPQLLFLPFLLQLLFLPFLPYFFFFRFLNFHEKQLLLFSCKQMQLPQSQMC